MIRHPVTHLTSNYRKDKDSNNYKILDIGHQQHLNITKNLELIELWRDVDETEGFPLDKIGKNVLELRDGREDEVFRRAIAIKIRGNLSAGTIEDLNALGYALFGNNFINVSETWYQPQLGFEPAGVILAISDSPSLRGLFLYYKNLLSATTAGGVSIGMSIHFDPIIFTNRNQIIFSVLRILLSVWNITRPRGMTWNGSIQFNGEHTWGSDIQRHGIKISRIKIGAFKLSNNNLPQIRRRWDGSLTFNGEHDWGKNVEQPRITINRIRLSLNMSYRQAGISWTLTSKVLWNGLAHFDGQTAWNGLHKEEDL